MPKKITKQSGFTMVELMVTVLIASIIMVAISGVIADASKGYNQMYNRIHGDIINDAYVARLRFDKICRSARAGTAILNADATTLQVLYYSKPNNTNDPNLPPDRYAEFYLNNTNLMLDTGTYNPNTGVIAQTGTETVARNVVGSSLKFSAPVNEKSVQMVMTLDKNPAINSDYSITVTCGSIMHN